MRWVASNMRTFLLALVLGTAVWISSVSAADPDDIRPYTKPIPIEIVGQDPSLILTGDIPPNVEVSIRAPRSVWETLSTEENAVRAILDLTGLSAGEHTVEIQIQVAIRPTQVVGVNPRTVKVNLETFSTATLPITVVLSGQPAAGFKVGEATPASGSESVVISGPEPLVEQAQRARVSVNLDGVREDINDAIPIQIIDQKSEVLRGLTLNPETIQVHVPISQQGGFRDLAVKVVVQGQIAPGYRLENISVFPPVVTVLGADPTIVSSLPGVVDTEPLDLQDAKEDISTRLALTLPDAVTLVGAQTVQVQVSITPIQTSITLANLPINIVGLGEGLSAETFPQTVDVIVSGPLPVLDVLPAQDVKITVNVTDLGVGNYQLTPEVQPLNANVSVQSILPGTVEVVISIAGTPTPVPPTFTPEP